MQLKSIYIILLITIMSEPVHAYIGPGMAGGVIAATLGIIIALLSAIFGILWFPIRRILKNNNWY